MCRRHTMTESTGELSAPEGARPKGFEPPNF